MVNFHHPARKKGLDYIARAIGTLSLQLQPFTLQPVHVAFGSEIPTSFGVAMASPLSSPACSSDDQQASLAYSAVTSFKFYVQRCLVGGFNPSEKYQYNQIGSFPQIGMKIKMFETTTQLCSGAFVVNTNPFIFALAKTQTSSQKLPFYALQYFAWWPQNHSRISNWPFLQLGVFEGLLSRLCDFSSGVSHPIPWPSPDSLSMDAMASFEVAQSP